MKLNLVYSILLDFIPMPSVQLLYPFLPFDIKWKNKEERNVSHRVLIFVRCIMHLPFA